MSVLDKTQRYLRIDEQPDTPTVQVAEGVTFIATGNVGAQYTTTRVMDRAFADRFAVLMLDPLSKDDEITLLSKLYPDVDKEIIKSIAEVADDTRKQARSEDSRISDIISTRQTIEMASLALDGFTLPEIAEVCIYPFYSDAGGPQSEQTYMRGLIQKYVKTGIPTAANRSPTGTSDPNAGKQTPWNGIGR
jgi:hypothetical protein